MLNEVQEFKDYTQFPAYTSTGPRDTTYLGRFTLEAIRDFHGFDRVFTILTRHFLFQNGDPYENSPYDNEQIKADFNEFYQQMNGMPLGEMERSSIRFAGCAGIMRRQGL